jgi:hypothetical protein
MPRSKDQTMGVILRYSSCKVRLLGKRPRQFLLASGERQDTRRFRFGHAQKRISRLSHLTSILRGIGLIPRFRPGVSKAQETDGMSDLTL